MAGLNQVTLIGNLTRDPEMKTLQSGQTVANCGIAINERWRDRDGNQQESVTFVDFEMWGRQAEVLAQYCKKGKLVCITGKLKLDEWEDRETGQKRSKLKVSAFGIQMLGGREDEQGGGGGGQRQQGGYRDDDRRTRQGDGVDAPRGGNQGGGNQGGGNQGGVDFDDIPF